MDTQQIIDIYSKYVDNFEQKIARLTNYDSSYLRCLELFPDAKTCLDIACGPANISRFLKSHNPLLHITGIDLCNNMLAAAQTHIPDGTFMCSNILSFDLTPQLFDIIVCGFGLPYVAPAEISQLFATIKKHAHTHTIVYISCMQGEGTNMEHTSFTGTDTLQITYHSKQCIIETALLQGFNCIEYQEIPFAESNGSTTTDMIFYFMV